MTTIPPSGEDTGALPLSRQVSRAMLWNAALQPAQLVAGLASGLIVGNVLTPDAKGTLVVLGAMASTLGLLGDAGIERGLVKFLPEIAARHGRAGIERILRLVLVQKLAVVALLTALVVAARPWFLAVWRSRLHEPAQIALLDAHHHVFLGTLLALVACGALFDVYMQTLIASFHQRAWNGITLLTSVLRPVLLAGIVLAGAGVLGVLGVLVAVPVVALALAARRSRALRRSLPSGATLPAGARLPARFLTYAALSFFIQASEYAYSLDLAVLALPSLGLAAGFQIAWALIAQVLTALRAPLVGVQIPLFSRLHQRGDARQLEEAYALLSKFLAAVFLPAALGLALLGPVLLTLLWPQYAAFGSVVRILAVCLCLDAAIGVPRAVLMACERYLPILLAQGCALLGLPLVLLIAPRYGAIGVAWVLGSARLGCGLLTLLLAQQQLSLRYPVAFVRRVGIATGVLALAIVPLLLAGSTPSATLPLLTRLFWLAGTLCTGVLGAIIYLAAFRLTGGLEPADRRRIIDLRLPGATLVLRLL